MSDEKGNTGNWNTGNRNTGDRNTGIQNTGDWNTGYRNTGDWNTGDWNTGDWNTGNRNTGDRNTGAWNTGDWNTGYLNTGDWNTGDWNTGDWNTGYLNTGDGPVTIFGIPCEMDRASLVKAIYEAIPHIPLITFIDADDMTDSEKKAFPNHSTIGGYLKAFDSIQDAGEEAWAGLGASEKANRHRKIEALPNYNAQMFFECTGIDLRDGGKQVSADRDEILLDGVRYRRVED